METSSNLTVFSVERAAHELGVSDQTLRNWIAAGDVVPSGVLNGKQAIFTRQDIARIKTTNERTR